MNLIQKLQEEAFAREGKLNKLTLMMLNKKLQLKPKIKQSLKLLLQNKESLHTIQQFMITKITFI